MIRKLAEPRSGQAIVMVALLMTVLFGMLALAVDFGFVIVHRRQQQNAADAAARGVAKALAGSVAVTGGGTTFFLDQWDGAVMSRAQTFASGNWVGPALSRSIAIQYLDCSGNVIRSAVSGGILLVPNETCQVRATGTANFVSFFIRVLNPGATSGTASATATARIAPTTPLTSVSGLWPITRWIDHPNAGNNCLEVDSIIPCVFWSNNGGSEDTSIGPFKEKLFFSRYSQRDCAAPYTAAPLQVITAYDTTRPGEHCAPSSTQQFDLEHWFKVGFKGTISVGNDIEATDPGNQGHNYSNEMRFYVNDKPEGTHPFFGNYRTVHVALWRDGHVWHNGSETYIPRTGGLPPDRITVEAIYCFRFYDYYIDSSEVRGWRVDCLQDTPPLGGPPGGGANTVQILE